MRRRDILLLYDFNCWANHLLLDKAAALSVAQLNQKTPFPFGTFKNTLCHILDSEYVWRTLCQEQHFSGRLIDRVSFPNLETLKDTWREEEVLMRAFLEGLNDEDFDSDIHYEAEGKVITRVLWHCLLHMMNHGTQHRSQAASILKSLGQPVGSMDMTHFLNQRAARAPD